jgi:putative tryptophan/tyrosine transport system substrate-binding protein
MEEATMTRRTLRLLVTLAIGLLSAPLTSDAQTPPKILRLGILEDSSHWGAFRQGLRDLGYVEGQNMAMEWRVAEGNPDRLAEAAAELVRLSVDILVTFGTPAIRAAMHATATIPIVMVSGGDPVRTGLVASLARPGGNVTGSSIRGADLGAKQLQVLREGVPTVARVAFLWNPLNPGNVLWYDDLRAAARALGVTLHSVEVPHPGAFDGAFAAMLQEPPDALIFTGDPMHQLHLERIIAFAAQNRLPVMSNVKANVPAGALLSYGPSWPEVFQRAALYVDKILKGAKPGDLPVQQPTTFELVINLKTAQALGLTIPPTLLFQAEEVIR